jgi:hypothetical protein
MGALVVGQLFGVYVRPCMSEIGWLAADPDEFREMVTQSRSSSLPGRKLPAAMLKRVTGFAFA